MTERDEYLLKAAYVQGWMNANHCIEDGRGICSLEAESERWVNEVIADNGGTVGEFISHEAPST